MLQNTPVITEDLNIADAALPAAQSIVAQSLRKVIAIPLVCGGALEFADSPAVS